MIKQLGTKLLFTSIFIFGSITALAQENGNNAIPEKADPAAWNLLKSAHGRRESFPVNVTGANAELVFNDNGKILNGKLTYTVEKGTEIVLDGIDEETREWITGHINNILAHRRGGEFIKGDGKNPITYAADDNSPIGRRIELNDRMKSSYRIHDNRVVEVDRTMGNDHFVVNVIDVNFTEGGKFLPKHYIVNYFDNKTGAMTKSDTYSDGYAKVKNIWFPVSRKVIHAENNKITMRTLEFKNPSINTK